MHGHRRRECVAVAHDREPAVVGDVERLVGVGRPRVGVRQPAHVVGPPRRHGRPQPEGAVHVHPGAVLVGDRDAVHERVEVAGVDVAGLQTTIVGPSSCASADARASGRIRPWASTGTTSGAPSPRKRSGRSTDGCRSAPTRTRTGGPPTRPRRMSWPTARQDGVAAGSEAGEVRHRGAGHEADRALVRAARAGRGPSARRPPPPPTAAGVSERSPAFWSHAEVSQSAPRAAGSAPPMTMPKKRPDGIATSPGSQASASRSTTSAAGRRPVRQVAEPADDLVGVDRRRHRPVVERRQPGLRMSVCPLQCRPSCLHRAHPGRTSCARRQLRPGACTSHSRDEVRRAVAPALAARARPGDPRGCCSWSPGWSAGPATPPLPRLRRRPRPAPWTRSPRRIRRPRRHLTCSTRRTASGATPPIALKPELPLGGKLVFGHHRFLVAYYGTAQTGSMGVLGPVRPGDHAAPADASGRGRSASPASRSSRSTS